MTSETVKPVGVGVIGLGRGFVLTLPAFDHPGLNLVAACAPRADSRQAFEARFGGRTYEDAEALCADEAVEAVYIATPHGLHRAHVLAAARAGKHALVDKPIAIALDDALDMVAACEAAGVQLITGPSHSFDPPVLLARQMIESGEFGAVRMVHALNYTDFLYRPRRPEELRTEEGGGVLFSQAIHQIDVVRLLAGGRARDVMARTGAWDPDRPSEGAYSALLTFEGGAFASITYSGYAHFDSDEWMGWTGELGTRKDPDGYGSARRMLAGVTSPDEEIALKRARTFGADDPPPPAVTHEHFGPFVVSCDRADLRLTPQGVFVYGDREKRFVEAPFNGPRHGFADAIVDAVRHGGLPAQSGGWGLASLEVCHAILESARCGKSVALEHQKGTDRKTA